ncbi:MAG TPA: cytochrome P450 [Ktedonobacteraceae bacterium]|nr:cytochrome P450 [Ktedonobacteraceae bacterium]
MTTSPANQPGPFPFRFFEGQFTENPYPMLANMRAMGAIVEIPLPYGDGMKAWMVTRMEEAVQVLKDRRFTVDRSAVFGERYSKGTDQQFNRGPGFLNHSMIMVDEPDHRRLRGLVSKAFTPKYIAGLRPDIQQIADELLDKVQEQGSMDLVSDFAYPLPINVISDMLGVPRENRAYIREWSQALAGGGNYSREQRRDLMYAFSDYVAQLVAEKRRHPQDDLISHLITQEDEGDHLSESELLSMVGLLIFAGHETTSNLIGIGTLMLLDHPDQLEKLKADPSLVPSAVEELLRYNGPVAAPMPRFALEDIELGGQHFHKGDLVLIMLASADRDETFFTDPEELDIARNLNRHIAFGQGIHICLGAPLARLEGDIAFTTLLRRMPNLRLNVPRDTITWRGGFNLRGLVSLPVAF